MSSTNPVRYFLLLLLIPLALSGCAGIAASPLPTPLPSEYVPTAIALTMQAAQTQDPAPTAALPAAAPTIAASDTPEPAVADTAPPPAAPEAAASPTPTLDLAALVLPAAEPTSLPMIPNNNIEIRNLGSLSRVTSPIHLYGYLQPGAGGKARIELLGEDRRLLFGETRTFDVPPGGRVVFSMDIEFEIAAVAEAGRLQISVQDEQGRITGLNSVPLILLSVGDPDVAIPADVFNPIYIQQPSFNALIQGGKVVVSGLSRSMGNQVLVVRLLDEKGKELGMRLIHAGSAANGGFTPFAAEVDYQTDQPTAALITVSEGEASTTDLIHLSSREIFLSP